MKEVEAHQVADRSRREPFLDAAAGLLPRRRRPRVCDLRQRMCAWAIAIFQAASPALSAAPPIDDGSGRLLANEDDGVNWASYGRTYYEQHSSPLSQIDTGNVRNLGLAWSLELPGTHQGATVPLEVDGTIYFAVDQAIVRAVDVRSGNLLWTFNPRVMSTGALGTRIGYGSRGIAYWNGKIYVGTGDGRLMAIDARSGKLVWSTQTTTIGDSRYITGAPRAFRGLVLIGHGGADTARVRGYVTAYDAETGAQRWRFYTVPGNPANGFENQAMRMAAKTWKGSWWKWGGGGTVWNSITYDPDLNLVYLGAGNGLPWNQRIRSPGGGDNLFLSSIIALDADSGEYRWHYQTNPGEEWDYKAAMDITLATLTFNGVPRKVILHAPTNGFFYVIDRETGRLISAEKYGKATWASRIDLGTGRPVENPGIRYENSEVKFWPGTTGAHNWQPMAFDKTSTLVFIPYIELAGVWNDKGIDPDKYKPIAGQLNIGLNVPTTDVPIDAGTSSLIAWDPLQQRIAWKVLTPLVWNGGLLSTAGGLVFQGQGDGWFNAYDSRNGTRLWRFYANMGISGAPISYSVAGQQYVTVVAGWGSTGATFLGSLGAANGWQARQPHRLLTFALDGHARLPKDLPTPARAIPLADTHYIVNRPIERAGAFLYSKTCINCHGAGAVASGYAPDLRASGVALALESFDKVVRKGALRSAGMPSYPEFSDADLRALKQFIRARAEEDLTQLTTPAVLCNDRPGKGLCSNSAH
jgi:quinohemoprotein ethanol dehydrogenase